MGCDMHDAIGFLIESIDHLQGAVTRADRLLDAVAVSPQSLDDGFGFMLGGVEGYQALVGVAPWDGKIFEKFFRRRITDNIGERLQRSAHATAILSRRKL